MKYRVRLVLEFEDAPSPAEGGDGSARFVELDPVGDPALAGAGALSAVLEEEAAFRLLGHLSSELERGLELETGSLAGLAGRTDVDGSRFGLGAARCESPLEAYCERDAVFVVHLLDGSGPVAVCSPCGERLWAEGVASEPDERIVSVVPAAVGS